MHVGEGDLSLPWHGEDSRLDFCQAVACFAHIVLPVLEMGLPWRQNFDRFYEFYFERLQIMAATAPELLLDDSAVRALTITPSPDQAWMFNCCVRSGSIDPLLVTSKQLFFGDCLWNHVLPTLKDLLKQI